MKSSLISVFFLFLSMSVFSYTSYTDTSLFTVDVVNPTLNIVTPNGGEDWYIGDTDSILWQATDSNFSSNPVSLWYTLTGGSPFLTIEEFASNSGSFPWSIPTQESNTARIRIRVIDTFGNYTQKSSAQAFHITYVPPTVAESLNVDISNNLDAVLNWQPVTQTIYHTPITPDGYIILYNETPYEDEHYYYFLGRSYTTNYIHQDVTEFRNQMFYKVKAYKNYTRDGKTILDSLCARASHERILWKDALEILKQGGLK